MKKALPLLALGLSLFSCSSVSSKGYTAIEYGQKLTVYVAEHYVTCVTPKRVESGFKGDDWWSLSYYYEYCSPSSDSLYLRCFYYCEVSNGDTYKGAKALEYMYGDSGVYPDFVATLEFHGVVSWYLEVNNAQ